MTDLSLQKRLVAEILGVGVSRVRIDPARADEVADVITREGIKKLIEDGVITIKPVHANSRARWRHRHKQKLKGRMRGQGKRKGSRNARMDSKTQWICRIRKIRRYLKYLRDNGLIDRKTYRKLYRLAKGGVFHSLASLRTHLVEKGILKQ
ncbi:MAG: 50S ribosomal protein L19e [Desulfurococcaceae archaeon]|uniref:Large ribosomal subunit protein eL19 n=1 Tax=Staphylothermus marinus TaxID=2280 RepID=A0A7C4JL78_STAMA